MTTLAMGDRRQHAHPLRDYRRQIDRAILLASHDSSDLEEWALSASNEDLLSTLRNDKTREELRGVVLGELVDRDEPQTGPFVVDNLSKNDLSTPWRNALIRATPRIQVTDDSLRATLATSLWRYAGDLKNATNPEEESVLWTAIRRYATLRPQADIGKLVEFLADPDEPLPRRHVVLLAIQNAFYVEAPTETESAGLEKLRARVSLLARRYLEPSWLETPHGRAVAQGAYCAAAALGCADLGELTEQNRALKQTWLTEFTQEKLSQLLERWRSRKDGSRVDPIHDFIRQAITKLTITAD